LSHLFRFCIDVEEDESTNAFDDEESVTDASVDMHGLGDKNPLMMLYEFCAKKNWKIDVKMDDKPSLDG